MKSIHILTSAEQVAAHLSAEIMRGALVKEMPGVWKLAAELGVDHKAIQAAMDLLERKGLLHRQGVGRPRRIVPPKKLVRPALRVKILLREPDESQFHLMLEARDSLIMGGHVAEFADRSLLEMKMDVGRVARLVKRTPADAWVVIAGSLEVLRWFSTQTTPSFALFGQLRGLPLAGASTNKTPVFISAVRRLAALGHRRIVYLVREEHRGPEPNPMVSAFLDELKNLGIPHGSYNLPSWSDSSKSFHQCLVSLFQHTPPTALIIDELMLYHVVLQFMAQRGIRPKLDVSMICADPIPFADWFNPTISHFRFDDRLLIRQMVRWADHVAHGKDDRRQFFAKVTLYEGGTIGPALPPSDFLSVPLTSC